MDGLNIKPQTKGKGIAPLGTQESLSYPGEHLHPIMQAKAQLVFKTN